MIIATRQLTVVAEDGHQQGVKVDFYLPVQRSGSWYCKFDIAWPDGNESGEMGGADSVQALFNALQMVGLRVYSSKYHTSGELAWGVSGGGGYGFPVPKAARNLLVGTDKRFYG